MAMSLLGTEYCTEELYPGDLIEISRTLYQHWAIYVGNGYVVHLAPPCESSEAGFGSVMSVTADFAYVKKEKLKKVAGTDKYQVNNKHDGKFAPLPAAKIVRRAEEMVGQVRQYSVFSSNCEHFVTNIRYGESRSDQVRDVVAYTVGGVALAGLVGGIFWMASKSKQQNREDDY